MAMAPLISVCVGVCPNLVNNVFRRVPPTLSQVTIQNAQPRLAGLTFLQQAQKRLGAQKAHSVGLGTEWSGENIAKLGSMAPPESGGAPVHRSGTPNQRHPTARGYTH
jgi:hypothetical protein